MNQQFNKPLFGISIDPSAVDPQEPFIRARMADEKGLDLITLMDHPYNAALFDTWTLLTALAVRTERVRVGSNVLNLPLRPPAMLAKMAASLDILSGGRLELGLGAGAYWDGVAAYGGPRRTPGEAYRAFKDALLILQGMWNNSGKSFTYEGEFYQVKDAKPGPAPSHPIRIWVGAKGPKMLKLIGQMAGGLLVSFNYVPPDELPGLNQLIDIGAEDADRSPLEIRRGYNLMGMIDTGHPDTQLPGLKSEFINGPISYWVDQISHWYSDYQMDTFNFWPVAGDQLRQIESYASEVVPRVKELLD
jgi:alkanesulfonate monooxygenase SsuD/methylene tetrahydromethanopterin reductase-like flavin-dependent oxidoreductase (luciferase family)